MGSKVDRTCQTYDPRERKKKRASNWDVHTGAIIKSGVGLRNIAWRYAVEVRGGPLVLTAWKFWAPEIVSSLIAASMDHITQDCRREAERGK